MCLSLKKLHQDWKIEQWSKKVMGLDLDLKAYEILIKELKSWKKYNWSFENEWFYLKSHT